MAMGKKEVLDLAATQLDLLKLLAGKNPDAMKKIAEMEQKFNEAKGEQKELMCKGCGQKKLVPARDFEFKKTTAYFTCPHGDMFCSRCVSNGKKEAYAKRKEENAKKRHDKEKKKEKK